MGSSLVQIGTFGEIKKTMKLLSKRDSHIDMEFICGENQDVLKAHRFIIGAQSRYLKFIMASIPFETEKTSIYLPDIEKCQMEVVLQFLYTGKMKLTKKLVTPVRVLLEQVLRIDADFKLPPSEDILSQQENSKDNDEGGDGGGDGRNGTDHSASSHEHLRNDSSKEPTKKRYRPSSETNGSHTSQYRENSIRAPMTPPHELESDGEEIQVITPPPKLPPPTVDLSENEAGNPKASFQIDSFGEEAGPQDQVATIDTAQHPREEAFESLNLARAPKIIAKRTGPVPTARKKTTSYPSVSNSADRIPSAPKMVAKRTGKHYPSHRYSSSSSSNPIPLTQTNEIVSDTPNAAAADSEQPKDTAIEQENYEEVVQAAARNSDPMRSLMHFSDIFTNPTPSTSRATRTRTGSINSRASFYDLSDDELFDDDDPSDPNFAPNDVKDEMDEEALNISPQLPPPIPEAPEPGLVLYRGKWIKSQKLDRIRAKQAQNRQVGGGGVRRYHWSTASITGRKLGETDIYRNEPEGRHECVVCGVVFSHSRSLQVHFVRVHNPKATVPCPENCGKYFTGKGAIRKHLLSHRPEHEWPFVCLFCGKHFQARADLPKHFLTNQHVNDPRIPKPGTPQWNELMKRSEAVPFRTLNPGYSSAARQPRSTISFDPLGPSSSAQLPSPVISISPEPEEVGLSPGSPSALDPEAENVIDASTSYALDNDDNSDQTTKIISMKTDMSPTNSSNINRAPTARKKTTSYPAVSKKSSESPSPLDSEEEIIHDTPTLPLQNDGNSGTVNEQENYEELGIDSPVLNSNDASLVPTALATNNFDHEAIEKNEDNAKDDGSEADGEEDDDSIPDFDPDDQDL